MQGRHRFAPAAVLAACATLIAGAAPAAADPGFRADPHEVVYDFVQIGTTTAPRTVTLYNPGTSANTIGAISIIGTGRSDFVITSDGCSGQTLPSGGGCQLQVVFRPTAEGTRLASMRIPDGTECPNWVTLAGSGSRTGAPPRAHAAICAQPKREVQVQVTPQGGSLPSIQDNSIIDGPKKNCTSKRRFRIRLSAPRGTRIESAKVVVAGKEVKTSKRGGRTTAMVDLRGRRRGTALVQITINATNGRTYKGRRTYRTCASKEAGGSPRY